MLGALWLSTNIAAVGLATSFGAIAEDVSSLAASSVRPKPCQVSSAAGNIWRPTKSNSLTAECNALARGYARLAEDPRRALADAEGAGRSSKTGGSAATLRAMALLGQGRVQAAWSAFEKAGRAGFDLAPVQRHDFARAAWMLGHRDRALEAYRALLPMLNLLPDDRVQSVHLEAGLLAMSKGHLDDLALGYFNRAKELVSLPAARATLSGALCLALDRAGEHDAARGVARESSALWPLVDLLDTLDANDPEQTRGAIIAWKSTASSGVLLEKEELYAMVASLAVDEPSVGRDYYGEYMDRIGAEHRWRPHASSRLAALLGKGPRR